MALLPDGADEDNPQGVDMQLAADTGQQEESLPALRPDLRIYRGPNRPDGSPTFTLYDPLNRTFDKLGWAEAIVLERMKTPKPLSALHQEVINQSTVQISPEELKELVEDVVRKGLTTATIVRPVEQLLEEDRRMKIHPVRWLLHHYLYFRIPLLKPDRFLDASLDYVRILASRPALILYTILTLLGLVALAQHFQTYISTFAYFFNLQGVMAYGLTIIVLKTIHEFCHAYIAKGFGVRVPVMGIAFIVLWPVAFCDVTDAWKISDRRKRLLIGLAGIISESIVAGIALFGWAVTDKGMWHSIFFILSSVSLASTLLVNLNPAMRFDGYYILMDTWGIDNLQPRAFAVTRWFYRNKLLGMDLPQPEPDFPPAQLAAMIVYSIYAWIYRFFLYLGIAVLVYYKFTKALGIFLFLVEIWWFLMGPVIREVKDLIALKAAFRRSRKLYVSLGVIGLFLLWFSLPLPRDFTAPAVIAPRENQVVYAPSSGSIADMSVARGYVVDRGDTLLTIVSPELDVHIRTLEAELKEMEQQKELLNLDVYDRSLIPQKQEEVTQLKAELETARRQMEQNQLKADIPGTIYEWDEHLENGMHVAKDTVLGRIARPLDTIVQAYVPENRVQDVAVGDEGTFFSGADFLTIEGRITKIEPIRREHLEHLNLTSQSHGDLPVVQDHSGRLRLLESFYLVELELTEDHPILRLGLAGKVHLTTPPRSRLMDFLSLCYRTFIRESGF